MSAVSISLPTPRESALATSATRRRKRFIGDDGLTEYHYEIHNGAMDILQDGEVHGEATITSIVSDVLEEFLVGDEYQGVVYIKIEKVKK
jgi:hypothetical protein